MKAKESVIEELVWLIRKNGILNGPKGALCEGTIVVKDLNHAKFLANLGPCPFEQVNNELNNLRGSWTGIRQMICGDLESNIYDTNKTGWEGRDETIASFQRGERLILNGLEETVRSNKNFSDLTEEIYADFGIMFYSKHFKISNDRLAGLMYDIYRSGGWPCGWKGLNYPEGNIIAYWPY